MALDVKQDEDFGSASQKAKRRHARPPELNSDDDDNGKEDHKHQDEETSGEVEAIVSETLVKGNFVFNSFYMINCVDFKLA